ncbi:DUF3560 domain-containing protein [Bradyrhizobium stylosanthis]|uniref:Uncharacterized protein DUF3560 n=1 Tax=Bradyrhizobium stylosanthis TaxID=1803665 RepID=A0A560CXH6_9BRAD|nr:DUF3560 domain-containing protein [Bradyrhizobium stylosanthis]TWA89563.1 uncharacterized protein DUF3560 [Bradyrhizobium stylosanthis]
MRTIIITGNTYAHRRELRRLGALWNTDAKGYVAPSAHVDAIRAYANSHDGLDVADFEATDQDVTPATGERLRELRQARLDRRRERLLNQAANAEKRGDAARARISPHERDFLALMEPVKRGHHSQRRHEKLLARAQKSFMDAGREYSDARKLRERAECMAPARVAGDAERERQAARDAAAAIIEPGDKVRSIVYGDGVVTKANKNTFTINFTARGFIGKCDKSHVSLLEKGTPEAAKVERKFKVGDLVTASRGFSRLEGKVVRLTPRGYSVEYHYESRISGGLVAQRDTFSESSLEARA